MLDKEDRRTRMLPKSSSQKTLRAAMQEERATLASRLLSPDASVSNPSFRVYYGVASAGSVPFVWESAPGTPKNAISDTKLPPLTPPPSYYNNNKATKTKFVKSQSSKKLLSSSKPASFVQSIIPKQLRRSHTMPARSSSSSGPPSSKDGGQCNRRNRLLASPRSSFSSTSRGDDEEEGSGVSSPTSTLCFRARHSSRSAGRTHGLLSSVMGGLAARQQQLRIEAQQLSGKDYLEWKTSPRQPNNGRKVSTWHMWDVMICERERRSRRRHCSSFEFTTE